MSVADPTPELLARIRALEAELADLRAMQWDRGWNAEAVLVHDLDGRILDANERVAAMLGYSVDELCARDMFSVEESLRETGAATSRENWAQIEAGAPMVARGRFVRRDGGTVPVELTLIARDGAGERRLMLVARDITDRLRVERALRDSEQRFRFLFEAAPVGMLRASGRGALLQVNRALCGWLGHDALALGGTPARELVVAEDRPVFDDMSAALRAAPGEPVRAQLRVATTAGRVMWGQLTLFAEVEVRGELKQIIGVLEDIDARTRAEAQVATLLTTLEAQVEARTGELQRSNQLLRREIEEREGAEAELILARERAEAASQAKSRFLMVMSHELRTPLNAILGYSELLIEAVTGPELLDRDEHGADLWRIRGAGTHLLALIDDILHMTRLESGAATLERTQVAVAPFLRDLGAAMREQLARPDLEFVVEIADELGLIVTDAERLRHVLRHLLRNAAKFTPRGSITLRASRRGGPDGESLHLEVRDTGIGIAREHLGRLFAPFVQIDDSPTRRYGGLGLGLALCRRYCDELGAQISVESEVQRGSAFFVRVPVVPATRPPL